MVLKPRSVFRPCIDLHNGQVKQIVGGTLSDDVPDALKTNFVSRLVWAMCDETILISNLASPQETSHVYTDSTTSREDMLSN
jgi:phosphoribosylformimino-5-aminoimidazole carboxamide ribonucleotide (ProFAR) isomerase